MLTSLRVQFKRLARRSIWGTPAVYFPIGIVRGRGNVFRSDFDLYISGFPRSGNSFAVKAFLQANPGAHVRSHRHIPTFVLQFAKRNMPGMLMLRKPVDAAISWAIFNRCSPRETLAYYCDYYSVLVPYREALFVVSFEEATADFGRVIRQFNTRWGTRYAPFRHTPENVARCLKEIEAEYLDVRGKVIERRVPRPSKQRRSEGERLLAEINRSPALRPELNRAMELYRLFSDRVTARQPKHSADTTRSSRLRPVA